MACPAPSLFSGPFVDGGLVILSRFPIIEHDFEPYPYGVLSDGLSYKGILYAKILVRPGHVLHLFNTHTQASYFDSDLETFAKTFETRARQLEHLRAYIAWKTADAREGLIIVAGDFNVPGPTGIKEAKSYTEHLKGFPGFERHVDALNNEYSSLVRTLSGDGKDEVIDLLTAANQGQCQVTFGELRIDELGLAVPIESIITGPEDSCTCQCLDYMFLIKKKTRRVTINPDHDAPSQQLTLQVDIGSTQVEKFFVEGHPFTQLSDHYGISTQIHLKNTS